MTRPKRAAAVRAASTWAAAAAEKENGSPSDTPEGTPVRSLRRATFRSNRHGARDLKRRRADFERVVKYHQAHLHKLSENHTLDASLTDDALELSQDDVVLTSEWAHQVADEPLDPLRGSLRALLLRLQGTCNLTEAADENTTSDLVGKPPSEDENVYGLAVALVTERFMSHEGEHVKLLVACCLAELLRICAPDPPIPERKLNQLCALFIEQLAVLAAQHDPSEPFRFSLLEQLATVKTFVIFCDDDEVICDVFACFYAVVKQHQSDKVKQYFTDILVSLLEEAENLSNAALDALLAPFVTANRYTEDAIALAARVLHGASSFIQVPLSSLLNASLRDLRQEHGFNTPRKPGHGRKSPSKRKLASSSGPSSKEHSEHHEHMEDLIVAINRVSPDVLVYVIPNLEDGLTSKDETRRLAASTLLGRLFASRADVANAYPSLFAEFLNKGRDESAEIRADVTATLGRLMKLHSKHREYIDDLLRNRVFDRSEAVRIAAVQSIGRAGDGTSAELLKLHATRLRDKKQSIRQVTAEAVNELYTSNAQPKLSGSVQVDIAQKLTNVNSFAVNNESGSNKREADSVQDEAKMLEELESRTHRLSWLPDTLVESMVAVDGVGDHETARAIEKIILNDIPALKSKNRTRRKNGLRQLSVFLSHLSDAAYVTLSARLRDKWKARSKLVAMAEHRLKSRRAPQSHSEGSREDEIFPNSPLKPVDRSNEGNQVADKPEDVIGKLAKGLATCLRRRYAKTGDSVAMCELLATKPDLKCFESLIRAVQCSATFEEHSKDSKSALASAALSAPAHQFWSEVVLPDCYPGVFSAPYFAFATEIAIEESGDREQELDSESDERSKRVLRGVLRFLDLFGIHATEVLEHVVQDLKSLCVISVGDSIERAEVLLCGLRLLSRMPGDSSQLLGNGEISETLESLIVTDKLVVIERGAALAKAATRAVICIQKARSSGREVLSDLVNSLVSKLDSFSGNPESIVAPLTSLSQFAKHYPEVVKSKCLGCFDFSRGLLSGALNAKIEAATKEKESDEMDPESEDRTRETLTHVFGTHTEPLAKKISVRQHFLQATVVQQAAKLLVYSYMSLNDEELTGVVKVLLTVAFEKRGNVFGASVEDHFGSAEEICQRHTSSSSAMQATCRLFAGRGILYLSRQSRCFRGISPSVLCSTVLLLQDENPRVRICFATGICNAIIKKRLPLRWVVGLALMAVDSDRQNVAHVKALLSSVFRHRRRVYEQAKRESQKTSVLLLPEVAVPELIWVLANLPDVDMDEASGFQESEKCLQLFLDRLLESNDHAGILHEYIESLSIAQDVTEEEDSGQGPRTQRITELGQIAAAILKKKQAGKKWNLTEHPGPVSLPKDMFRVINRNVDTSGVRPVSLVQVARRYDEGTKAGSGKKKPGEIIREAKASPVEKQGKGALTPVRGANETVGSASRRVRSVGKRRSPIFDLSSVPTRQLESPPKRPRIPRGQKRSSGEVNDDEEDSLLRDSPQRTGVVIGDSEEKEDASAEKDTGSKDESEVLEASPEKDPPPRRSRRPQVRKRSKGAQKPAASCTTEAKQKLSQVRRSARNRGL